MTKLKLTGLVAATHTPFHADGTLNLSIVEKQAEHLFRNGVSSVFIGGSTGESHSLNLDERRLLTSRWMDVARGTPMKVIVHVGSNCLVDAASLASHAQQSGAVAVAALSPSYFKPRDVETLVACAQQIASAAPQTPFYFYDIPVLTNVSLSMPDFLNLGRERIPNLAGLKFTNPDLMSFQLCLRAGDGSFDVPWGCDEFLLAATALGATGAVGSTYNFGAPIYLRLLKAYTAGDMQTARDEQFKAVQMIQVLVRHGFIGAAKAVMKMLGVDVGPARLPISNLTSTQVTALREQLESIGFFDWVSK